MIKALTILIFGGTPLLAILTAVYAGPLWALLVVTALPALALGVGAFRLSRSSDGVAGVLAQRDDLKSKLD